MRIMLGYTENAEFYDDYPNVSTFFGATTGTSASISLDYNYNPETV